MRGASSLQPNGKPRAQRNAAVAPLVARLRSLRVTTPHLGWELTRGLVAGIASMLKDTDQHDNALIERTNPPHALVSGGDEFVDKGDDGCGSSELIPFGTGPQDTQEPARPVLDLSESPSEQQVAEWIDSLAGLRGLGLGTALRQDGYCIPRAPPSLSRVPAYHSSISIHQWKSGFLAKFSQSA